MPHPRDIEKSLIDSLISYTDKLRFYGDNSVNLALVKTLANPLSEASYQSEQAEKAVLLKSAEQSALDSLGLERGLARVQESFSSTYVIFQSENQQIVDINLAVAPGVDEIEVQDGSEIDIGMSIRITQTTGSPPLSETKTVTANGANANFLRVSTLANTYAAEDFVIVRVTVPEGTEVQSTSGISFKTTEQIVTGDNNVALLGESTALSLSDKVLVRSMTSGVSANVQAFTITTLVSAVDGIQSVTNPLSATGRGGLELDGNYRSRIQRYPANLNQTTQIWFEEAAKDVNTTVLRTYAEEGTDFRAVNIIAASRSGATLSANEKTELQDAIEQRIRGNCDVTVTDVTFTSVEVTATISLRKDVNLNDVYIAAATRIANFLDWRVWDFGQDVDSADLLSLLNNTDGVDNVEDFTPTTDVSVAATSLPRFVRLALEDEDTGDIIDATLTQSF